MCHALWRRDGGRSGLVGRQNVRKRAWFDNSWLLGIRGFDLDDQARPLGIQSVLVEVGRVWPLALDVALLPVDALLGGRWCRNVRGGDG